MSQLPRLSLTLLLLYPFLRVLWVENSSFVLLVLVALAVKRYTSLKASGVRIGTKRVVPWKVYLVERQPSVKMEMSSLPRPIEHSLEV